MERKMFIKDIFENDFIHCERSSEETKTFLVLSVDAKSKSLPEIRDVYGHVLVKCGIDVVLVDQERINDIDLNVLYSFDGFTLATQNEFGSFPKKVNDILHNWIQVLSDDFKTGNYNVEKRLTFTCIHVSGTVGGGADILGTSLCSAFRRIGIYDVPCEGWWNPTGLVLMKGDLKYSHVRKYALQHVRYAKLSEFIPTTDEEIESIAGVTLKELEQGRFDTMNFPNPVTDEQREYEDLNAEIQNLKELIQQQATQLQTYQNTYFLNQRAFIHGVVTLIATYIPLSRNTRIVGRGIEIGSSLFNKVFPPKE